MTTAAEGKVSYGELLVRAILAVNAAILSAPDSVARRQLATVLRNLLWLERRATGSR
jgi:hypothetical protein